ncbi:MAG: YcgN family cysteine cluster protein [Gammaproteobacteria bacterium]|nr:YcgN family cysteine cluster protein [Gammaproteobacteria bacterium]
MTKPFWQSKSLFEMTTEEWESLCDGCGKCCLQQLQDEDSGALVFTDVACDLLNKQSCRCTDYPNRSERVPTCMTLTPQNVQQCAEFAPSSCAYRLLVQGDQLPPWHHLRSGDKSMVHRAGASVSGKVRHQREIAQHKLQDFIVEWPENE